MDFLKDRRTVLALAGAAVALLAGLAIAWTLVAQHSGETAGPPPASRAGLVIDSASSADARMDSAKPLRCFVAGQFAGQMTLAECAKRNGVATDALDVGLDQTGALAAADQAGAMITPLPPAEAKTAEEPAAEAARAGCRAADRQRAAGHLHALRRGAVAPTAGRHAAGRLRPGAVRRAL